MLRKPRIILVSLNWFKHLTKKLAIIICEGEFIHLFGWVPHLCLYVYIITPLIDIHKICSYYFGSLLLYIIIGMS